jgi:hypothetical protein
VSRGSQRRKRTLATAFSKKVSLRRAFRQDRCPITVFRDEHGNLQLGAATFRSEHPTQRMKPAKTGTLPLAVVSVTLCHIINFYSLYRSGKGNPHIYQFLFGDLTLVEDAKHISTFVGLSNADFASEKLPF